MTPERHLCILHGGAADLWPQCAPLLEDVADDGLKWLYIADAHGQGDVRAGLETSLGAALPAGEVVDAAALGLLDAPISVSEVIGRLRAQAAAARADGFAGLFLFMEMTWLLHTASGTAHQGEFEAALHELVAAQPMHAACLYNRSVFPESMMLDALRTHPGV